MDVREEHVQGRSRLEVAALRVLESTPFEGLQGPDRGEKKGKQWLYPSEAQALLACDDTNASKAVYDPNAPGHKRLDANDGAEPAGNKQVRNTENMLDYSFRLNP